MRNLETRAIQGKRRSPFMLLAIGTLLVTLVLTGCTPAATPQATATAPAGVPTTLPTVAVTDEPSAMVPSVIVEDQEIIGDQVVIAEVTSAGPGWLVIHADQDGAPGPVIGQSAVQEGENLNVVVDIETANATETLYAMLHVDEGVVGTYEFPGADGPATADGEAVTPAFMVTGMP